ncbi:MAG: MFS transporter [archaeon]|nr:MFS transporter [archaeon]
MDYKYIVIVNTTIASFMALLDSNIVLISLPTIIRELPGTPTAYGIWVILGYSLMLATILLTIGRLSDIHGRVKLYNIGFAIFTIGSALCSFSLNGFLLILFRLIQGVGSALIFANGTAIITDAFPQNERGRALGINQIGGITGSVVGLVLGGVLTQSLGWRSIFWINIPIGGFATFWAYTKLKEISSPLKGEKPDALGMGLYGIGLTLFLLGLTFGSISGWIALDVGMMVTGLVLIIVFGFAEVKIKQPMMDLSLFKIRQFFAGILSNLLAALARGSASIVFVFYFQGALLEDALTAGIKIIPFSIAFVLLGPLSGYLSDKYGSRRFATAGLLLSGVAFVIFALLPVNVSYNTFVIPMVLVGAGGGMFIAPNIASIMNSVPTNRRGIASGISATVLNSGFLISIGISFAIMAESMPISVLQQIFAGYSISSGTVNLVSFHDATTRIFLVLASLSFLAAIPAWFGTRDFPAGKSTERVIIE